MSVEANKAVVRRYFDAVNASDCAAILALTSDDFLFTTMARAPATCRSNGAARRFRKCRRRCPN